MIKSQGFLLVFGFILQAMMQKQYDLPSYKKTFRPPPHTCIHMNYCLIVIYVINYK